MEENEGAYGAEQSLQTNVASSLLVATLDPMTQRYIDSKTNVASSSQNIGQLDLRKMCQNVKAELEEVEKAAAYDYLKVEREMHDLNTEIDQSDSILGELESVLHNFRDHLNDIKSEMTNLQERSLKMNTSLTNRKNLEKLLSSFMDSAVLDPKLIDAINLEAVDEKYVEYIKVLCQKLEYLKNTHLQDATAVKELEPKLNQLKNKACGRVREFLLDKISLLKKPMTNINIMQKSVLIKYRIFTEFLKVHYLDIYVELCQTYAEVMSKIYLHKFKSYIRELEKLQTEVYTKTDTLLHENAAQVRQTLQLRNIDLQQDNRSIFYLMKRDETLRRLEEDKISYQIASQKQERFLIESVFKSISKILLDSISAEVIFTSDFFNLTPQQHDLIFGGIFKQTFNYFFDYLKSLLQNTYDCTGVLLTILVNEGNKKFYAEKLQHVLNFFFDQVSIIVWPRFETLFESHINSIKTINLKVFKQLERQLGWRPLCLRYVDLALSIYKLYSHFDDNRMLSIRLQQLRAQYHDLIARSAADIPQEFERIKYLLHVLDFVLTNFNQASMVRVKGEFSNDLNELEKEINKYADKFVNIFMGDQFGELIKFVKTYCTASASGTHEEHEDAARVGEDSGGEDKKIVGAQQNKPVENIKLIENICSDLNFSWNKRMEQFRLECEKMFSGTEVMKKILKKFMNQFMSYYGAFYKYLKGSYSQYGAQMVKIHDIMKEIKKIFQI